MSQNLNKKAYDGDKMWEKMKKINEKYRQRFEEVEQDKRDAENRNSAITGKISKAMPSQDSFVYEPLKVAPSRNRISESTLHSARPTTSEEVPQDSSQHTRLPREWDREKFDSKGNIISLQDEYMKPKKSYLESGRYTGRRGRHQNKAEINSYNEQYKFTGNSMHQTNSGHNVGKKPTESSHMWREEKKELKSKVSTWLNSSENEWKTQDEEIHDASLKDISSEVHRSSPSNATKMKSKNEVHVKLEPKSEYTKFVGEPGTSNKLKCDSASKLVIKDEVKTSHGPCLKNIPHLNKDSFRAKLDIEMENVSKNEFNSKVADMSPKSFCDKEQPVSSSEQSEKKLFCNNIKEDVTENLYDIKNAVEVHKDLSVIEQRNILIPENISGDAENIPQVLEKEVKLAQDAIEVPVMDSLAVALEGVEEQLDLENASDDEGWATLSESVTSTSEDPPNIDDLDSDAFGST